MAIAVRNMIEEVNETVANSSLNNFFWEMTSNTWLEIDDIESAALNMVSLLRQ